MDLSTRVRSWIQEIAGRRASTTLADIERVLNALEGAYIVKIRPARHGLLCRVGTKRFMVNTHNPGSKNVKKYSVDDFLDAMVELGLYDEQEGQE